MPANSLGTLNASVVVIDTIAFLKKIFPMITRITTDFSSQATLLNQTVVTRVVTPPPTHDYVTPQTGGTGYAVQDAATTVDIPVTINKHKFATLAFSDTERSATNRDLPDEQKKAMAYSLGRQIMADLFALVTPTNFTNTYAITAAANANRHTVAQLRRLLVVNGASVDRFGVVNADVFAALSQDPSVISQFNYGASNPELMGPGSLSNFSGFQRIDEYAELATANSLLGLFAAKEGLLMASRVPDVPDLSLPGVIENIADPDTGLTIQYREYYDMMAGLQNITLTLMYGVSVGLAGNAVLLIQNAGGNPN